MVTLKKVQSYCKGFDFCSNECKFYYKKHLAFASTCKMENPPRQWDIPFIESVVKDIDVDDSGGLPIEVIQTYCSSKLVCDDCNFCTTGKRPVKLVWDDECEVSEVPSRWDIPHIEATIREEISNAR